MASCSQTNVHLHNEQSVLYDGDHDIEDVVMYKKEAYTMFLAWFEANRQYVGGRDLTYAEFPTRFTYEKKDKQWQPRKLGYQIGRLHYTLPGIWELYYMRILLTVELYYMRILLTVKKGCMRYRCIKTINGHTYDTFQEVHSALGLLDDDK
ncbi:helicase, putative [Medicago truncatula]|uniref:Helicase, putative n=1 Tax=Medicago truncatula TaxID=3880 RepID=A0A072TYC7_MEDTR|nr:helicase, putative [Medicago truncatula]